MRLGTAGRTRPSRRTGQALRPAPTARRLFLGGTALLLAVVTAACGGGGGSSSGATQASTAPRPGGSLTVQVTLAAPDGAFINQIFDSTADWIASPAAVQKMGEKAFAQKPVGAGPFMVVSNTPSSVLVLKKNPGYWQKGRPYLDSLTFKT